MNKRISPLRQYLNPTNGPEKKENKKLSQNLYMPYFIQYK